jgi:energy-coupling factor transport system ATP-binding protein
MIRADAFSFTYPTTDDPALEELTFRVDDGEVLGVLGPVEAGKTTLSMALAGFAPQNTGGTTSGDLSVAGHDPREGVGNDVAMVFEDYAAQLTQVRVIDEVVAPLVNRGVPRDEATERARELLDRVRMAGSAEKFTWELSGGEQQRLAIAAALAVDPEVLVFDTATDMLDPAGRDDVGDLIASLKREQTLVVTENDPDALVGVADRLLLLADGQREAFGPADELLRDADRLRDLGVSPPTCCAVADEVGVPGRPLTPGEFVDAMDDGGVDVPSSSKIAPTAADGGDVAARDQFGDPVVRMENASYEYSADEPALDGVDLSVREGEVHAVLGGNGAGKTTLSKLLVGLFEPDSGTVYVDGEPTDGHTARAVAETVGIALQNPDEHLSERTVEAEIRFPLEQRRYERTGLLGLSKRERYDESYVAERVETVRRLVGLSEADLEEDPMFLPRGKRRQVSIAGALAPDPDALVLDEPVAGLDATARGHVRRTIDSLCEDGTGVVVIDHDVDFVCEVADTVTVLEDGDVAIQGPTREVFEEDNWEWLARRYMHPPRAARLARRVGVNALTADGFVDAFRRKTGVSQ